jgi:hypothetical protein
MLRLGYSLVHRLLIKGLIAHFTVLPLWARLLLLGFGSLRSAGVLICSNWEQFKSCGQKFRNFFATSVMAYAKPILKSFRFNIFNRFTVDHCPLFRFSVLALLASLNSLRIAIVP